MEMETEPNQGTERVGEQARPASGTVQVCRTTNEQRTHLQSIRDELIGSFKAELPQTRLRHSHKIKSVTSSQYLK
ncbi:hypothetical protein NUU61_001390 [Penicillium alfredii]|uniref:Uncharacterized protein n=1 Tax=Penicillium alfredii TaxID=1506179 RepID=A0A9W9G404_9EURO|nr:uncharacterized protein NUU61_001390 [Penicillium alfredii]KAJ5111760.1 hypothetical protein NUU61_001390 [Penicillium alfredii]